MLSSLLLTSLMVGVASVSLLLTVLTSSEGELIQLTVVNEPLRHFLTKPRRFNLDRIAERFGLLLPVNSARLVKVTGPFSESRLSTSTCVGVIKVPLTTMKYVNDY